MNQSRIIVALACSLAVGTAGAALAGAPQPDQRQGSFEHVCQGGPRKAQACTVPTQDTDCPRSTCVVRTLSAPIRGTLTIIAHDSVTDWLNGGSTNRAVTMMLEVRGPDGSKQMLAATYQDLALPTDPPQAPSNVVAIPMDELSVLNVSTAVDGMLFIQPESSLSQQLQTLFNSTGTPVLIGVAQSPAQIADHNGDNLATVLRFKVRIQFVAAL